MFYIRRNIPRTSSQNLIHSRYWVFMTAGEELSMNSLLVLVPLKTPKHEAEHP